MLDIVDAKATPLPALPATNPGEPVTDRERMQRIFRRDGDNFRLDQSQLKGESKQSMVQRLTYLLLYAHDLEGRDRITKTEVISVIRDAGLYDSNTSKVFSKLADLFFDGEMVGLRLTGRDKAREFLK